MKERILVIKLGALGDLVLCMRAFASIRAHHPEAEIALLTAPAFASFALQMPWFDAVLLDPRPKATQLLKWIKLISDVRRFKPSRVYDFQGKARQTILYHALGKPAWSGAVRGCSHPRAWPPEKGMHYTDFLKAQLESAEVPLVRENEVDLLWLDGGLDAFALPEKFAILIIGCSPQHPYKKWPAAHFAELANRFAKQGIASIAIGTKEDAYSIAEVRALAPEVIDLSGRTSLGQVAALTRRSVCVVGNDTGPTHLAAAVGARTIALMSDKVDPLWSCPKGPKTTWLGGVPTTEITVEKVWAELYSAL